MKYIHAALLALVFCLVSNAALAEQVRMTVHGAVSTNHARQYSCAGGEVYYRWNSGSSRNVDPWDNLVVRFTHSAAFAKIYSSQSDCWNDLNPIDRVTIPGGQSYASFWHKDIRASHRTTPTHPNPPNPNIHLN